MARLVELIGVSHSPFLPRLFARPDPPAFVHRAREGFADMRRRLAAARPDVIVVVANDHLHQWFLHNMPVFLVGLAPESEGPFSQERTEFGVPTYRARIDVDTAQGLLDGAVAQGADFARSHEFGLDHAFTIPLTFLRPEGDVPIVPLFTNVMAPPLPPSARFFQVGTYVRNALAALPDDRRVAVVATGHMSLDIGGPREMRGGIDPEFDGLVAACLRDGDPERLIAATAWERLMQAGNQTPGVLNYVLLAGIAGGRPATLAESSAGEPFFCWDLDPGSVGEGRP